MNKKIFAGLFAILLAIPIYSYASPNLGQSYDVSEAEDSTQLIPITIGNSATNGGDFSSTAYRNQIDEIAQVNWDDAAGSYRVSLRVGSYSALDYIAILKEKSAETLLQDTRFDNLPGAALTFPNEGEFAEQYSSFLSDNEISQEYDNDYWLINNGLSVSQNEEDKKKDAATITFYVTNLENKIYVKTYGTVNNRITTSAYKKIRSQEITLNTGLAESIPKFSDGENVFVYYTGINSKKTDYSPIRTSEAGSDFYLNQALFDEGTINYKDGVAYIELQFNDIEDPITKIDVLTQRGYDAVNSSYEGMKAQEYLTEYVGVYETIFENSEGAKAGDTVEIPFYDDIWGQEIRVFTKSLEESNAKKNTRTRTSYHGVLHLSSFSHFSEMATYEDQATGVIIEYPQRNYPDGSTIRVETGKEAATNGKFNESTLDGYIQFADDYRVYTITLLDDKGQIVQNPAEEITIKFPVSQDWNPDLVVARSMYSSSLGNTYNETSNYSSNEGFYTVSSRNTRELNAAFFIYEIGTAEDLTSETVEENQLYKVNVVLANASELDSPSMANAAFANKDSYIYKDSEGNITLWSEVGGVEQVSGDQIVYGYLSSTFYDYTDKLQAEYLAYQTLEDNAELDINGVPQIKRMRLPLVNPIHSSNVMENNAYSLTFYIPIMDGLAGGEPGSGAMARSATVKINNLQKVENNINPLDYYDTSVVKAEAFLAQKNIADNTDISEAKKNYINRIAEESMRQVQGEVTSDDQEFILYARDTIRTAVNSLVLDEGYYRIPFMQGSELDNIKINSLLVEDGNITLTLEMESGSISSFQYHGEYGEYQSATLSDETSSVSFTLPYTESTIFVQINGTEYEINLDFSLAELSSANMSELRNTIQEAEGKLQDGTSYTTSTLEALTTEIQNSKTLLTNLDAEQSEVDAQTELLKKAIDGLKEKASDDQLTELSRLKREIAAAINDETYTSASRAELKEFYDELTESTADTDNISTEDYEQYVLSIEAAMAALEEATEDPDDDPDHSSDNQVLSLVEDYRSWLDESDFTADSWAAFSEVLDAAEALSQNELTETEIQEEIDKILEARNGLIYQTNYEDQIEELAAYLDEVEADVESQGFPGYIGYDSLVSAIAAADYGVARNSYLSENQILALKDSVTFHYDALLEEDNLEEETTNSIMLIEDYIPEVILDEDLLETEADQEELDTEKESAAEESESSGAAEESSSAAEESTEAAEESTEAAEESTGAEESTEAAEESTSVAEESTEIVEESSSTAEESTGAAEESSDAEKETSGSAEENTGETEADSSADEETASPNKEDSELSPEENQEEEELAQEEENISEDSLDSAEESEDVSISDSDEEDAASEKEEGTEKEEADQPAGSSEGLTVASISPHITYRVMAAATRSSDYEDGTYYVDYDLWKWDDDSLSMGNAALDYGDQLGRMILDDGTWTLYIHFNQLQYDGIVGELKEMKRMVNIKQTSDGLDYDTRDAEYPETIEDYPSVLGFTTSQSEEYIPIEVNVPLMTAGPIQVARLIVDWDSLEYINGSTDINSSMDLSKVEGAVDEAEGLKEADYTSWSWQVVEDSLNAAEQMIRSEWATQAMIDTRAEALEAAIDALVPVAGSSDKLKLSDALLEAYIIDEADYSSNALLEIGRAREAAEALENADDVTAPMIETAIRELEAALSRSGTGSEDDPDNPDDPDDSSTIRYTTLQSLIQLLEGYDSSQYTDSSWKNLQTALESAKEVLEAAKNGQATQDEVDDQVQLLKDTRSELVLISGGETSDGSQVNYKYLNSLISRAKTLLSMTGSYTEASLRNLQTEYDLALVMLDDEDATQEDVDEQKENLRSAINSLVIVSETSDTDTSGSEDDNTDDSGSNEDEGYYEVDVDLWHATLNKASMGDPAVNKTAYVYIDEDGDITMRLVTKKMTTSGITTHLYDYYYYEDGDYEEAELISSENSKWIFEFPLPNDNDKYYKCKVDPRVDVMGDDPVKARLKVDWDSLDEVDEDDWNDLEGDVDEDDDDDSTYSSSSSTSGNPTLQSGETGIRIYGNVGGPGIVLEVVKKENGPEYDMTHGAISSQVNRFVLYDVRLKSGTGYVQPTSSVTMQIPIPTGYDTSKLVLYRIGEDGSYTTISGKVNGSYYEATVDHFSLYALAESNQVTETAASSGNDSSSSGSSSGGSSSRTRTTSSRTSSRTSSVQSNSSDTSGNHVAAGREIPYTGDPMPVKELAGVGFLAAVICLGTVLPDLRRKLESRKQQEE